MSEKEFREKVMPLQRRMFALALRAGLPPDDAADAVQETQLRLWRAREGLPREDIQLSAYCMAAVRNECISILRRKREMADIGQIPERGSDLEALKMEQADTRRFLETLIETLPEGQRKVIRLSGFAGFDVPEISEATGFSPGNVRQLLSRGRKRIRLLMEQIK